MESERHLPNDTERRPEDPDLGAKETSSDEDEGPAPLRRHREALEPLQPLRSKWQAGKASGGAAQPAEASSRGPRFEPALQQQGQLPATAALGSALKDRHPGPAPQPMADGFPTVASHMDFAACQRADPPGNHMTGQASRPSSASSAAAGTDLDLHTAPTAFRVWQEIQQEQLQRRASPTATATSADHRLAISPPDGHSPAAAKSRAVSDRISRCWPVKEFPWRWRQMRVRGHWPLAVTIAQAVGVIYIMVLTFAPSPVGLVQPESGFIDPAPRETVLASNTLQCLLLAVSRASAFSLYPPLVVVMLTKCKALLTWAARTPISIHVKLLNAHELHAACGRFIAVDSLVHVLAHVARWLLQSNGLLLFRHPTGLTGLVAILVLPLISLPMMLPVSLRRRLSYEVRKGLHTLFIPFYVALALHVPPGAVPNGGFISYVMGGLLGLWVLDSSYCWIFMTQKVSNPQFTVLPSGVQVSLQTLGNYKDECGPGTGGYVYVCLPWVSKHQWHAFSVFTDPGDSSKSQIHILNCGDWTAAVHKAVQRSTRRPLWVQGPFPSPYNTAALYDNQILIASGIGITPALSVIEMHRETRRVNLVWIVRDVSLLQFYLDRHKFCDSAWNLIFYTGREPLAASTLHKMPRNVWILNNRPNLHLLIPSIIYATEINTDGNNGPPALLGDVAPPKAVPSLLRCKSLVTPKEQSTQDEPILRTVTLPHPAVAISEEPAYSGAPDVMAEVDAILSSGGTSLQKLQRMRALADRVGMTLDELCSTDRPALPSSTFPAKSKTAPYPGPAPGDSSPAIPAERPGQKPVVKVTDEHITSSAAPEYLLQMPRDSRKRWGLLYCGGAKPIVEALQEISTTYKLACNVESFQW